jgi:hypothetical protein
MSISANPSFQDVAVSAHGLLVHSVHMYVLTAGRGSRLPPDCGWRRAEQAHV